MRALVFALLISASATPAFAADTCATLEKQTQAFSDAGQRGDGEAMAKDLDPDVIFFNETGDRATKTDMASETPSGSRARSITTTDWNCAMHGDVAVTSFIDVLEQGQPQQMRFRSVETWMRKGATWQMIGSETLTLQDDPPGVALDPSVLDEYAGVYEASPDMKFTFSHKGTDLVASLNGSAESVQKIQARDIVFTPGHAATPKVFQRNGSGKITGFVYLRGTRSLSFRRTG